MHGLWRVGRYKVVQGIGRFIPEVTLSVSNFGLNGPFRLQILGIQTKAEILVGDGNVEVELGV